MSGLRHSVTRRFSIATTRTKTIEKNISNDYTTEKHALLRHKATLEKSLDFVKKGHSGWKDVGESYKKFSELIDSDTPLDSPLHERAVQAKMSSNTVHDHLILPPSTDAAPSRLVSPVRAYISELETIEKQFPEVENLYIDVLHYQKKVNKNSKKASKASDTKSGDNNVRAASRNVDKLENCRASFTTKLEGVLDMMKRSNAKYVKVLECAHTAYWLYEDAYIKAVEARTNSVRATCANSTEELLKFDVTKPFPIDGSPKMV